MFDGMALMFDDTAFMSDGNVFMFDGNVFMFDGHTWPARCIEGAKLDEGIRGVGREDEADDEEDDDEDGWRASRGRAKDEGVGASTR